MSTCLPTLTLSSPVDVPIAVGRYTTWTVQLAPAARDFPQVLLAENGAVALTDWMASAELDPFLRMRGASPLALPNVTV